MKRLESFTRDELIGLTEEGRAGLADLECAYEGIPLLPPKPEKQEIAYPEMDVDIYSVDDHDFLNQAEAQRYAEYVNSLQSLVTLDYDFDVGNYDRKYIKRHKSPKLTLEKKKAYSEERYQEMKSEIARIKKQDEVYSEQVSEYRKALNERSAVYQKIDGAIRDAWNAKRREDTLVSAYEKYKAITGDSGIALKLVYDAYGPDEDEKAALKNIICNEPIGEKAL